MAIDRTVADRVLRQYARAIVHMRQQKEDQRFGLVLGAGTSVALGFPDWTTLLKRIAKHPEVNGEHLLTAGNDNTSLSQILFQQYRARVAVGGGADDHAFNRFEAKVRAGWQKIVHACLYDGVSPDTKELIKRDVYLQEFLDVVKNTRLTINYNFDDSLQRMLDEKYPPNPNDSRRSHSTVWNANIQMFPRDGVIYHPNGYLPFHLSDRASEQLVFLEDSFADQLIDSMAGHYVGLSYHLAQATRLLLGLSLADPTLKHLLRQNAVFHPGHYHYYVAYVADPRKRDAEYEKMVVDANFAVYNLVTMFLTAPEIAALGALINLSENEFKHLAEEVGEPITLRFLLTGSVGVGKSTVLSHFRSLRSYDEWLEPRKPGMEKDPGKVDPATLRAIDEWVAKQLDLKNIAMLDAERGIHIVDRAPLDALAFTPDDKWKDKAALIKTAISPGKSNRKLVSAHIILLWGDPEVMAVRAVSKHKETDGPALTKQQALLEKVYCSNGRSTTSGTTVVDTRDKTINQVVKEVGRIILQQSYYEAPLHEWLEKLANGAIHA